ncbi:MAG: hypothetical protein HY866_21055 [Chloroflexi bacterium]|nr:hypothetical protein [Chloroflexota bacterium]
MVPYRRIIWVVLAVTALFALSPAEAAPLRQDGLRIVYNETVQGTITDSSSDQEWQFSGHTGDLLLIDLRANVSGLDTYLTLLGPDGSSLRTDDDGGDSTNSRIGPYQLASDGDYTIVAARYSGTGEYSLELKDLRTLPMITDGKPLVGALNAAHTNDYFLLSGDPDQPDAIWSLGITGDNPYALPYLSLYGPGGYISGTETAEDYEHLDPIVTFPEQAYVVVVSMNAGGGEGSYELRLTPSEADVLADGVVQEGELDEDTYSQQHYFRGQEGDRVRVTVEADGEISPGLYISSADRSVILFSNDGEFTERMTILIELPSSGVYLLEVIDGSYQGNRGSYTLRLDWQE